MPLEQISRLFSDLYGYELNSETVERALEEGYEWAVAGAYVADGEGGLVILRFLPYRLYYLPLAMRNH